MSGWKYNFFEIKNKQNKSKYKMPNIYNQNQDKQKDQIYQLYQFYSSSIFMDSLLQNSQLQSQQNNHQKQIMIQMQSIPHLNQQENIHINKLTTNQIPISINSSLKTQSKIPTILQKKPHKISFLPSISKSLTNIQSNTNSRVYPQRSISKNTNSLGQHVSFIQKTKLTNFKAPKSLQITKKKQKTFKDQFYLPAFIRNFQLPPKKKIQVTQTMDQFKKRQAAIKVFLSPPQTLKKYRVLSHIGKGSFSIVSQAINIQTHKKLAIKTYVKFDQIEQYKFINIGREIQNMTNLNNHKNVVQLQSVVMQKRKIMLIMENCGQLSLAGILRKRKFLPQLQTKQLFRQIIQGISYCHQKNICHRDLKLQNILVNDANCIKIIDFGFSNRTQKLLSSFCGTPPYMAPQITSKKIYEGKGTDIWSIGVILYVMLYGYFPFRSNNEPQLFRLIQQGKIQHNQTISQQAKQTINKMLKTNPNQRASSNEILNLKWLQT